MSFSVAFNLRFRVRSPNFAIFAWPNFFVGEELGGLTFLICKKVWPNNIVLWPNNFDWWPNNLDWWPNNLDWLPNNFDWLPNNVIK